MLQFYEKLPLDLMIIEGFKREKYPKVLMIGTEEGLELLDKLTNIVAVISWIHVEELKEKLDIPVFSISDEEEYLAWIKEQVSDLSE